MDFKNLTEKEQKLAITNKYDLFRNKCIKLNEKGVDNCELDDDFNLKGVYITEDAKKLIELAIPQIIDYKGLIFDRPLEGLGIGGFYYFMSLFYFERKRQLANLFKGYIIDNMLMKNSVNGDEMWFVNKAPKISDTEIEMFKKL